jgi:sugar phosphate isomerase/epimerase
MGTAVSGALATAPLVMGHYNLDHVPFEQRCAVASAAGFSGISVEANEILGLFDTVGERRVREVLARAGVRADHVELVALPGPPAGTERDAAFDRCIEVSVRLGARGVHAVPLVPDATVDQVTESFAALSARAAQRGVLCGLEFVPFLTCVPDLPCALRIIRDVDDPNAMLVVDSLHFFGGGAQWDVLEHLPTASIMTVQLNDGQHPTDPQRYLWFASAGRSIPGDGDFDLPRFMAAVDRARLPAPVTVEVLSDELDQQDPLTTQRRLVEAARRI